MGSPKGLCSPSWGSACPSDVKVLMAAVGLCTPGAVSLRGSPVWSRGAPDPPTPPPPPQVSRWRAPRRPRSSATTGETAPATCGTGRRSRAPTPSTSSATTRTSAAAPSWPTSAPRPETPSPRRWGTPVDPPGPPSTPRGPPVTFSSTSSGQSPRAGAGEDRGGRQQACRVHGGCQKRGEGTPQSADAGGGGGGGGARGLGAQPGWEVAQGGLWGAGGALSRVGWGMVDFGGLCGFRRIWKRRHRGGGMRGIGGGLGGGIWGRSPT